MDLGSVFSGSAFKAAFRGSLVFVTVLLLSGAAAFQYLHHSALLTLQEQVAEDQILLFLATFLSFYKLWT